MKNYNLIFNMANIDIFRLQHIIKNKIKKIYKYLGSMFSRDGRYEMHVERRIATGNRVKGALAALMGQQNVSTAARLAVHNAVLVPTLLYGIETWYDRRRMKER